MEVHNMANSKNKVSMGIPSLNTTQITDKVVKAWRNKQPILLYGPPGIGKTQGILAAGDVIAKELMMEHKINPNTKGARGAFSTWLRIMSSFTPEDIAGLPYTAPDEHGITITKMAKTAFVPTENDLQGMFFLDEIGNAEDYKMGPLQSLTSERVVGEHRVPDGVVFVFATNRPEDGTGARELPSAIRNRCMQYEIVPPMGNDYIKLMRDLGKKLHKYVEGFLLTFPSETYTFDPNKTASATLRSWDKFSSMVETNKTLVDEVSMLSALVGTEIGSKYRAWRKLSEKVDLKDIIANPKKIVDYEHDKGLLYNIALGLLEHAEKARKNIPDVFRVTMQMEHDEFSIYMIKNMMDHYNHNTVMAEINKSKDKQQIIEKLVSYTEYFV